MPIYKGNRGNLLQHWVLTELIAVLARRGSPASSLCLVDAYAMSPYATRDTNPGQTYSDFDLVRDRLPGQQTGFERAWKDLRQQDAVEYPTSAMFVHHLWPGPIQMTLCEMDDATAQEIGAWKANLPERTKVDLHHGDWRKRFRGDFPQAENCIVSFDPYAISGDNRTGTTPGNMYLCDVVRAAAAILEIQSGPLFVQMSTYDARANSQDALIPVVQWVMAAVGLEFIEAVRADGHMMSMIFGRALVERPAPLQQRFSAWLAQATKPA